MGLDNATVKEFANLINPFDKTSGEATVYGRVVGFNEIGGRPKVQLDGSSQIVPIRTTVKVKGPKGAPGDQDYYAGDRVLVRIKNHEALIVSNISTQMTTAEGAEDAAKQYVSDNGFIYAEKITGEQGDFYTLSADKFTATEITGALGHFITVNADRIITDAINAQIANIDTIKASDVVAGEGDFAYLNVDNVLDAKMANLDTANVNKANIGSLLAEMGLISSATIVEGHVTGYLDSVEVNANKITAGTLLVDRLYIKDQNNKWKMQTVDGQGHTVYVEAADRINERTITADKLVAHSITTDELNVSNLTAGDSVFMTALTNTLEAEKIFVSYEEADSIIAGKIAADLAELDILNINEELKTQNIHLGEIVFDQPTKPEVMSGNPDYLLGIERETKTISAYDSTALYSEGDYVTHYYSDNNLIPFPFSDGTKTIGGITYTSNNDGSMTINGTATSNPVSQYLYGTVWLPNGEYDVRSNSNGSVPLTARYNKRNPSTGAITEMVAATDSDGNGAILKITNGDNVDTKGVIVTIITQILRGTTINNVTMYPLVSKHLANEEPEWYPFVKGVYKCIKPITTAELWDENKWYYLRDAINGNQYEFDHVRYTDKINSLSANELTVSDTLHLGNVKFDETSKIGRFSGAPAYLLGIEAFADGGDMKWQSASSVAVGKATSDSSGNQITTSYQRRFNIGKSNTTSDYVLITINSYTSWMLSFDVNLYSSYYPLKINISGYNYGSNHWFSPKAAVILGQTPWEQDVGYRPLVRFGYTADYHLWVAIYVTGAHNYTGASISNVVNGYTQIPDPSSLFTMSFVTYSGLPGTIQTTITADGLYNDYMHARVMEASALFGGSWKTTGSPSYSRIYYRTIVVTLSSGCAYPWTASSMGSLFGTGLSCDSTNTSLLCCNGDKDVNSGSTAMGAYEVNGKRWRLSNGDTNTNGSCRFNVVIFRWGF